jgi:hypothetical protein
MIVSVGKGTLSLLCSGTGSLLFSLVVLNRAISVRVARIRGWALANWSHPSVCTASSICSASSIYAACSTHAASSIYTASSLWNAEMVGKLSPVNCRTSIVSVMNDFSLKNSLSHLRNSHSPWSLTLESAQPLRGFHIFAATTVHQESQR